MKTLTTILLLGALALPFSAEARRSGGTVHVRGHVTKTGRYVPPHTRTAPNRSKADNYSTRGNANPYSGKKGTK